MQGHKISLAPSRVLAPWSSSVPEGDGLDVSLAPLVFQDLADGLVLGSRNQDVRGLGAGVHDPRRLDLGRGRGLAAAAARSSYAVPGRLRSAARETYAAASPQFDLAPKAVWNSMINRMSEIAHFSEFEDPLGRSTPRGSHKLT